MDYASNVKVLGHFIEKHLVFLTLRDIMNLFLTNKTIHKLEMSFPFLVYIGHRCVDPNQPYSRDIRRYFKKLLLRYKSEVSEKTILQIKTMKELETKYVLSRNAILNSSGKYKFQGWKITANGEYGWQIDDSEAHFPKETCFVTSYRRCRMHYTVPIEKFLTPGITVEYLLKKTIFKGGIYISRKWGWEACGKASLIAYDSEGSQLSKQTVSVSSSEMSAIDSKKIEICFNPAEFKGNTTKFLRLVISGRAVGAYGGWKGAKFGDAYIRCYYNDIEGVSGDLDISKEKIDRKLTLEKESNVMEDINTVPKYDDSNSDSDSYHDPDDQGGYDNGYDDDVDWSDPFQV